MVWRKILSGLNQSSAKGLKNRQRRRLRIECMERRELLASDLGSIAGVEVQDLFDVPQCIAFFGLVEGQDPLFCEGL